MTKVFRLEDVNALIAENNINKNNFISIVRDKKVYQAIPFILDAIKKTENNEDIIRLLDDFFPNNVMVQNAINGKTPRGILSDTNITDDRNKIIDLFFDYSDSGNDQFNRDTLQLKLIPMSLEYLVKWGHISASQFSGEKEYLSVLAVLSILRYFDIEYSATEEKEEALRTALFFVNEYRK